MEKTVYVTGIGIVSPLGLTLEEHVKALKEGTCAITFASDNEDSFPFSAGFMPEFKARDYIEDRKAIKYLALPAIYACVSANKAVNDTGIDKEFIGGNDDGNGIIYGAISEKGTSSWAPAFVKCIKEDSTIDYDILGDMGYRALPPLWMLSKLPNTTAGQISIQNQIKGINYSTVNGANNSIISIGESYEALLDGRACRMFCGGSELEVMADVIYALSQKNIVSLTDKGSKSFDPTSDGGIYSSAGITLILEEKEEAARRNAKVYGRITGFSNYYIPDFKKSDALSIAGHYEKTMRKAIEESGLSPSDIQMVQASGCGIPAIDEAEALAIKNLFGDRVYVTCSVPLAGYTLAAAGAFGVVCALLQMNGGFISPIMRSENLFYGDNITYVTENAIDKNINRCICNSFDYYGSACSIVLQSKESGDE